MTRLSVVTRRLPGRMTSRLREATLAILALALAAPAARAQGGLLVAHDLVVDSMVSDRFTWHDSTGKRRVIVLAHNDGQVGPGGSRGGEMRLFKYRLPDGSKRVVHASGSAFAGFGYVVSHPEDSERCIHGPGIDTSALGHLFPGTFTRVFEGRHHAIFRFTQDYPRYCAVGTKPAAPLQVPVTIEWVVVNGRVP
jgi:hypothetical protein